MWVDIETQGYCSDGAVSKGLALCPAILVNILSLDTIHTPRTELDVVFDGT